MKKRCLSLIAALALLLTLLPVSALAADGGNAAAEPSASLAAAKSWYYSQLDATAKQFYEALESLYTSDTLKTGTASVDLIEKAYLTAGQVDAYIGGAPALAKAFQDGRDAFFQDHPDLFYIDATKVNLRVGTKGGETAAYLGSGSNANYYAAPYGSATQVEAVRATATAARDKLVKDIRDRQAKATLSTAEIVTLAHNALVDTLSYSYPSTGHPYVAGIAALSQDGNLANCVGYSSSLQWVLWELGIPSVLITGAGRNSKGNLEEHMWNYVQIEDFWYAVDATWDDPIVTGGGTVIRDTYLLKGLDSMDANHYPTAVFSPGGMTFDYPALSDVSYAARILTDYEDAASQSDLKIYSTKQVDAQGDTSTVFTISYLDKSINDLKAEGKHVAVRFAYHRGGVQENFQPWQPLDAFVDKSHYDQTFYYLSIFSRGAIQFAVTDHDIPVGSMVYKDDLSLEGHHIALSKALQLPYFSDYVAPPFIRKSEPMLGKCIMPQKTHYRVEYDEKLVFVDSAKPLGMDISVTEPYLTYGVENLTMTYSSFTLPDGRTRVSTILEFDFTPDKSYQGYTNHYALQPSNVVGESSRKPPNPVNIATTYPMSVVCPIHVPKGTVSDAFVVGIPTLVVGEGMDVFEPYTGTGSANALDIRLVATLPGKAEEDKILDASGETEIKSSAVYDLTLSCRDIVAKLKSDTDYNLTIALPYPAGFNYKDNENVEFKAYHYIKQSDGTYKAEPLVCRITPQGLEVLATKFSPFAIVAVDKQETPAVPDYKLVSVAVKSAGGKVLLGETGAAGTFTLRAGDSKTFTIVPDSGYQVERIVVNGTPADVSETNQIFTYEGLSGVDNTLEVSFVAETVKESETAANLTALAPVLEVVHLEALPVWLTPAAGKLTLSAQTPAANTTYYYKTTLVTDAANRPAVGDKVGSQWTAYAAAASLPGDPGTPLYVQVIAAVDGKVTAWGQASAAPLETLGELRFTLLPGDDKVTLSLPSEEGYAFYYKSTPTDDTANKPALDTAVSDGWTLLDTGKTQSIAGVNGTPCYVQVVKVQDGKIKAWGQTSATPVAVLESLTVTLTAGENKATLSMAGEAGFTYYYKTSSTDDAVNKPALDGSVDTAVWTALDPAKALTLTATGGKILYAQVIKVQNGKIKAWGQANTIPSSPATGGTGGTGGSATKPDDTVNGSVAEISLTAKVTSAGTATAAVTEKQITDAVAQLSKSGVTEGGIVSLRLEAAGAKALSLSLPLAAQRALTAGKVSALSVDSPVASLSFDAKALLAMEHAGAALTLAVAPVDAAELPSELDAGGALSFTLSYSGEKTISDFGGGSVTLSLPYKRGNDERADALCGVYLDSEENVRYLPLSRYDAKAGELRLLTGHFSTFAVAYRPAVNFQDMEEHWAGDNVAFAASHGLLNGTGDDCFSPDLGMTRGMFVTTLGRLAGADVSGYTTSHFYDVDNTRYDMPYIEWAANVGLSKGTGDGGFTPDAPVTREQMAVMLDGFNRAMGYTLPTVQSKAAFTDAQAISSWAVSSVEELQTSGLFSGREGGGFAPAATATRAETATVLTRYITLLVG